MSYPLLTQRLSIEPLAIDDAPAFVKYRQDSNIARYQSWETDYSPEQATELLSSQQDVQLPLEGNWLQLAIHDRVSGELLGDLALHSVDLNERIFEIGFTLAPEHQSKGIAIEAVRRLLDFLFVELNATRVSASCDSRNESSIKLLTTVGFKLQPEKGWIENFKNELVTVHFYEITKSEHSQFFLIK